MILSTTVFEGIMIFCWSVSWPVAVYKTLRTRTVKGVSAVFLWFVFFGYVSGILFKLSERMATGQLNPVFVLYLFNFAVVGTELILYYRYRENTESASVIDHLPGSG